MQSRKKKEVETTPRKVAEDHEIYFTIPCIISVLHPMFPLFQKKKKKKKNWKSVP